MTIRWILALTLAASVAAGVRIFAQAQVLPGPLFRRPGVPTCGADTPAQLQSRTDAFDAVTEITTAAHMYYGSHRSYPKWPDLAKETPLRVPGSGPMLDWGAREPLPGWRIHYVAESRAFVFTLTGVRDACGVTFVADDTGLLLDGRSVDVARGHVVPLSTH
jgi:hypothetical protein